MKGLPPISWVPIRLISNPGAHAPGFTLTPASQVKKRISLRNQRIQTVKRNPDLDDVLRLRDAFQLILKLRNYLAQLVHSLVIRIPVTAAVRLEQTHDQRMRRMSIH